MTYQIPVNDCFAQIEIKKSIFKAFAYAINDRNELNAKVTLLKDEYADARHHCFGYIIGDPNNTTSAGFDDDGEPSGTAGKPILNVLSHKKIGNCGIVVVRYFGGIKLGAGGLTRAYAQSAQAVIEQMNVCTYIAKCTIVLHTTFAYEQQCRYLINAIQAEILHIEYSNHVTCSIRVAKNSIDDFKEMLAADGNRATITMY